MASAMLADAKIEGPICTYSYSNRMRELCHYPEFYGRINMQILSKFKSTYGLALYENCIRYQNINQTPWFDLPIYRKLMGVRDGVYDIFRDLNKRVIKPSVGEVNDNAPIKVQPELKKKGRTIVAIRFLIKKQTESKSIDQNEYTQTDKTTLERLKEDYGCSAKQVEEILTKYGEQALMQKMKIIESSPSYQNGKIANLARYLDKALERDFQLPKSSKENLAKLHLMKQREAELSKISEEKLHKYRKYQDRELPKVFNGVPEKKRTEILNGFDNCINQTLYHQIYLKEGTKNPLVMNRLCDFIRSSYPELLAMLIPFHEFVKSDINP